LIPAQRLSVTRKAEQLGLTILAEYVEPGRSGTEMTKRVAFQQMLERIRQQKDVDFVIVYKLSRFARNRIEDAIVMADLQKRGVTLISATEQIDATPTGQLMHGILAAFNQYRSEEDGADIAYKIGQKAKSGGTIGMAPIGYLNKPDEIDGRTINSVVIDPVRAPYVKLAFELYAKQDYTLDMVADELTDRGLVTRVTARRPAGPISQSKIHQMLRDRYYLGEVRYKGEQFDGRLEALIDEELFNRVQDLLAARGYSAERRRRHNHYLKGTLWRGRCRLEDNINRRIILMHVTGRQGNAYSYFFCRGVQDQTCDSPYSNMDRVETAVEEHYKTIQFRPEFVAAIRARIEDALSDSEAAQQLLRKQLQDQIKALDVQEENLLDLAADGSLPQEKIRQRLRAIARDRERLGSQLGPIHDDLTSGKNYLDAHLHLLESPYELYRTASDDIRRLLNQAIFAHIYIVNDEVVGDQLNSSLAELLAAQRGWESLQTGLDPPLAMKLEEEDLARHTSTEKQDVRGWDALLYGLLDPQTVGDCSMPHRVHPPGLEPGTH
jgi:site-specific DNA recombinase